jgi:DNA-binding CsgD family transcriptional regulator
MIDQHRLKASVDDLVAATFLGEDWTQPLAELAAASGARDAVLMRNTDNRMVKSVATDGAAEMVEVFAAGRAPPNSRYSRVRIGLKDGFRIDQDDYRQDELARDPYYQEFLRPAGLFWHANAVLDDRQGEQVELSFKRGSAQQPYVRAEARALDRVLGDLRAASRLARQLHDTETRGVVQMLKGRGPLIFVLDRWGRVMETHAGRDTMDVPLDVIGRHLATTDRMCQPAVDRALATALAADDPQIALAAISGDDDRRFLLQVHPLRGRARDLFLAASAVAVVIERDRRPGYLRASSHALVPLFGLTEREADVVCLRAEGMELPAIAAHLGISPDTIRTYLKHAYDKVGVTRQAELVALVNRILL